MTEKEPEYIDDNTIVTNIKCNRCNNILPAHTVKEHLNINNPIHKCPHLKLNINKNLQNKKYNNKKYNY